MFWVPFAIVIGTLLAATSRRAFGSRFPEKDAPVKLREADLTTTPNSTFSDWVWPLFGIDGTRPALTDTFGLPEAGKRSGRGHFGQDVMRLASENPGLFASDPNFLKGTIFRHDFSKGPRKGQPFSYIFPGEFAIVTGPGKVFSAENTSTGHTVKISHIVDGKPFLTVHRHLAAVQPGIVKGVLVSPGILLGPVGDNPAQAGDPAHDHFELWRIKGPGATRERDGIDAQFLMERTWKVMDSKTGERFDWRTMGRVV